MSMYHRNKDGAKLIKEKVASLGSDILASLILEQIDRCPSLCDRLLPLLTTDPPTIPVETGPSPMVGASPTVKMVREALCKIAAADAPVLITGESGTGKELAAIAIHQNSSRSGGAFIPINCAALPKTLVASELFGYEKGAFTGADQRRTGRIQAAHKGTLFLDEIGDLPLDMQAHLLRFLQEGTLDRVGSVHPIKVDVRVIAATNVPLQRAAAEGHFREDLFFRLNVLTLEMPPLRQRGEDVEILADHFLGKFAAEAGKSIQGLSPQARRTIRAYGWPGNIRELMACIRRATVMADGPWILPADLGLPGCVAEIDGGAPLAAARRGTEATIIRQALAAHRNNVTRTAEHLGVSRVTLYRLMGKLGIVVGNNHRAPVNPP